MSESLRPNWMPTHVWKQLKFIVIGGALTWACNAFDAFRIALMQPGWTRLTTLGASGFGVLTIAMFLYLILFIPRRTGANPDYAQWRQSSDLSVVIPILTAAIPACWSLLSYSLATGSLPGTLKGVGGASGIMTLGFGLMGLIPVPKIKQ